MKNPVSVALAFALIAGMTAPVTHSRADAQMQDASPGIALGAKAPTTLALQTSAGKPTSLAKEMGPNGILVFCKAQLSGLNSIRPKLAEMGYALVSLSYDKPDKLAGFARTKGITFPMLSDQGSKLIDAMALRDPQYAAVPFANGVPYATVLVIGKDGRVKAKNVSKDYKVRPTNAQILAMIPRMKG
jgi:peroxiredoxin